MYIIEPLDAKEWETTMKSIQIDLVSIPVPEEF